MAESSAVVGMAFGLKKCGVAHMIKGRIEECSDEEIRETGMVCEVTKTAMYRYLGVEQVFRPGQQMVQKKLRKKFLQRVDSTCVIIPKC